MSITIQTSKLTRRFGNELAVDALDLSIEQGEIFGLLGPNAAGKSTTIRMLAGILQPSAGAASLLGLDLLTQSELAKSRIGYVAQQFALYPDLTVFENITFYAGLYGINDSQRLHQLLDIYSLDRFETRRAGQLSGGFKRRLALACATAHEPEVIFLDEPTAGIDPVTRKELWDHFYTLAASGKTLLVTTHYMEEAERCHRLAFLDHGVKVAEGSPAQIRASLNDRYVYACEIKYQPELARTLANTPGVQIVNQFGRELRMVTDTSVSAEMLSDLIAPYNPGAHEVIKVTPGIEDAFISLTHADAPHG